ncbi:Acyl carrier protein phosphodiesterase [hydrothermal vent metagenome]|uniref:Acyl carrier protein phosphodiesterase n=1 Tax=hydrothermal vent metagenome TaxID=652676 RepID=A0A3B0Y7J5_9ZZZZ
MNYLAHLFLSEKSQDALLGNLMGDFIKGNTFEGLTKDAIHGIKLHRGVDKYTDSHSDVAQSKKRISPERRRYAGILIDVFYDHFLVKHWNGILTHRVNH